MVAWRTGPPSKGGIGTVLWEDRPESGSPHAGTPDVLVASAGLENILDGLLRVGGVSGAGLVSREGACVLHRGDDALCAEGFTAMSAASVKMSELALAEARRGGVRHLVIEGDEGWILAREAFRDFFLVVVAEPSARPQDVIQQVDEASKKISDLAKTSH